MNTFKEEYKRRKLKAEFAQASRQGIDQNLVWLLHTLKTISLSTANDFYDHAFWNLRNWENERFAKQSRSQDHNDSVRHERVKAIKPTKARFRY